MSPFDLTTLSATKAWLGLPSTTTASDAAISALITAVSRTIFATLCRPAMTPTSYVDVIDGEGQRTILRQWPVTAITSVTLDGLPLPPATMSGAIVSPGYNLRPAGSMPPGIPQALDIFGYSVLRRPQNLVVNYIAGYAISAELQTIPAAPYTVTTFAPYGPWASDLGAKYATSGLPLVLVTGAPSQGQYSAASGVYSFAAADQNAGVSISYGYIPQDIVQAALELTAERFRAAERVGLRSKSVGGQETIAYDMSAVSAPIMALLQPYRRVGL